MQYFYLKAYNYLNIIDFNYMIKLNNNDLNFFQNFNYNSKFKNYLKFFV